MISHGVEISIAGGVGEMVRENVIPALGGSFAMLTVHSPNPHLFRTI